MRDLTTGNEAKHIFYFALPMLIGNIFQQLYNTVDSIIVGRTLGKESLAAVGASFPIMFLLISLVMGITMGSTIIIAQYYGAKDMDKVKRTIDTSYIFLFVASIIITITGLIFARPILILLKTPPEVLEQSAVYLNIMMAGMIVMFGFNSIAAILRGLGDSKTPLIFLVASTIINIILDFVFILVFGWGIAGAAWATVIAQGLSFMFGIIYVNKNHKVFKIDIKDMQFDKDIFKKSIKIGLPTGIQQMLMSLGMITIQSIVNTFGTSTIAAFTAAGRIDSFASMPIMNFGAAISTFVGQNLGANKPKRVKRGYYAALVMSTVMSIFVTITIMLFGKHLIALFNTDSAVIEVGMSYLRIVSVFYAVVGVSFITTGVLRGAGDTIVPMIISIMTLWVIRVPVSLFLSQRIGSDGIWWSIPIGWTIGLVLTLLYYLSGRWKTKVVVKIRTEE